MNEQLQFDFDAKPEPAPGELPRDPLAQGLRQWRGERETFLRELEERYGLILNRPVRIALRGFPGEFTGRVVLDELLHPTGRKQALRLRLGHMVFDHTDIDHCESLHRV